MADWVFRSPRKPSLSRSPLNCTASRAALRMSRRAVSSLGIIQFGAFEDRLAADPVRAALDRPAAHQIDLPAEQHGELLLHTGVVKQAPLGIRCKGHQEV